jgi:hypothetical protein
MEVRLTSILSSSQTSLVSHQQESMHLSFTTLYTFFFLLIPEDRIIVSEDLKSMYEMCMKKIVDISELVKTFNIKMYKTFWVPHIQILINYIPRLLFDCKNLKLYIV